MIAEILTYLRERHVRISDSRRCRACEALERQLLVANEQVRTLTATVINIATPPKVEYVEATDKEQIKVPPRTMGRLRQQLEEESAKAADRIRKSSSVISHPSSKPSIDPPSPQQLNELEGFLGLDVTEYPKALDAQSQQANAEVEGEKQHVG